LLAFLLLLTPNSALGQASVNSGASWSQYKSQCGIPASTAYNDWVAQGSHCPKTESASSTSPAVPALNPQQQLAMQGAALAGNMIGQALGQLLFGKPTPPTEPAQPDPEQKQRELAAQQLNNSGLYLLKQKNYAGAINEFQKALATNPNDSNSLDNLAMAKQQQKDAAVAGQTSRALGQFLGNAPANTGLFGFAQLIGSTTANPNPSALSLVNLDSDANVVDLRGTTKTSVDPESLKGQLDGVLGTNAPASEAPGSQVVTPQDKDMELLSTLAETGAPQSHVVLPQDKDMELLGFPAPSNESDLKNSKSSAPATAGNVGNDSGSKSFPGSTGTTSVTDNANPAAPPFNSQSLDGIGNPDFDGSTTGNAPIVIGHPTPLQSGVDLRDAGTTTVAPARVKGSSVSNGGSEPATPVAFAKSPPGLGGISAPGSPIFDCSGDAATINHLVAGLPVQQEAIRRSQAALDAARDDAQHDSAEARAKWTEGTIKMLASTASSVASSSQKLLAAEESLKAAGIPAKVAARYKFLEKVKQIHEISDKLEGAGKAYLAGNAFGNTVLVQKRAHDLAELIAEAGILLVDSGIAEEAGGKLALALWGPIGELGFKGVTTGLDLLTATTTGFISAAEADRAALNLEVMRSEYQRIQGRIYDLQQEFGQGCSKKSN